MGESRYFKYTEEKYRGIVRLPEENDKALLYGELRFYIENFLLTHSRCKWSQRQQENLESRTEYCVNSECESEGQVRNLTCNVKIMKNRNNVVTKIQ